LNEPLATFQEAFERVLQLAPSPLFPRARRLYLNKYPLEDPVECSGARICRFRTFLLEEEVQEAPTGVQRIRALRFAVVHWQAPQTHLDAYATYLDQRWQLPPLDLQLAPDPWFREAGAFARFRAAAIRERLLSGDQLFSN
jgi:hypothetical protein